MLGNLKLQIIHKASNPVVRGSLWKLGARIVSLFIQTAYFFLIARSLGAEQYGLFIGLMALLKLAVPFSNWGTSHILVKNVSRNRDSFRKYWGIAIRTSLLFGTGLLAFFLVLNHFALGDRFPMVLLFSIGLAELVFARLHDSAMKAFLACDLIRLEVQLNVLLSLTGLASAFCLMAFFEQRDAVTWGVLYLVSRAVTALIGLILVYRVLGAPSPHGSLSKPEFVEGLLFSIDLSSQTTYNDIDKTILASYSLAATGIYGAAYRIIEVGMIPVVSLGGASYAQFFRKGAGGIQGSLQYAKRIVPVAGAYGALASAGLWLFSPVMPIILGKDFTGSIEVLRWLAPIVFFKSLQLFAANTLTSAGLQGTRSVLQMTIAFTNVGLNLWLIPLYSWKGAAIATLICDSVLVVCLWGLVFNFARKQAQSSS